MVRALYSAYSGPLYLVQRKADLATAAIGVSAADGFAESKAQDAFCAGTNCTVTRIFDQSPKGNHLSIAPSGGAARHADRGVNASKHKITVGGHAVYGAYFEGGNGYRCESTWGVATGDEPESMLMVTGGQHYNGGCCFDYGNAEIDALDHGKGTMEAIYWGNSSGWGHGVGKGPWVMADLENGLWAGSDKNGSTNFPIDATFVTAMAKGKSGVFGLKGGDATQSGGLKVRTSRSNVVLARCCCLLLPACCCLLPAACCSCCSSCRCSCCCCLLLLLQLLLLLPAAPAAAPAAAAVRSH